MEQQPKTIADLLAESKRTADKKRYTELLAEIAELEIEQQLATNAENLEKEAREQAEFEQAKAEHLAKIEDLETKKRFLANNETQMIEAMITGLSLVKLQFSTYYDAMKLVKHLNREREQFGTPEQEIEPIDLFGTDYQWQSVGKGLLQRITELLMWNDNQPEHRKTVTPENVKIHPTKWGEKTEESDIQEEEEIEVEEMES